MREGTEGMAGTSGASVGGTNLADLRHQCAASGLHEHDGCSCSDGELAARADVAGLEPTDPSLARMRAVRPGENNGKGALAEASVDAGRALRLKRALLALEAAAKSAVHENENPNRVVFQDGFVIEGRLADEWLGFMRLIQKTCRAALDGETVPPLAVRMDMEPVKARWKEVYRALTEAFGARDSETAADAVRRMQSFDDFIEAGMAVAADEEDARGWKPMDAAPTDGRAVDLWVVPHDAFENGNAHRITDAVFEYGSWQRSLGGRLVPVEHCGVPVAWMDVPEKPSMRGKQIGGNER